MHKTWQKISPLNLSKTNFLFPLLCQYLSSCCSITMSGLASCITILL